ncbi:hypothetical protein HY030_03465 [Candidatus Gottesmanbacteria bacterium]|nr:hypothetical protein [Candidatus Gottesmanbacteria bacterium]
MQTSVSDIFSLTFLSAVESVRLYLPRFLAGLIILFVGLLVSSLAKRLVLGLLKALRVGKFLESIKVVKEEAEVRVWETILAELIRWSLTILFLVPTVEAWGLSKVTDVLNQMLLYLPNVFVAVIVGLVGVVVANLTFDVVRHGAKSLGSSVSNNLGVVARYAILFFTVLVVLNQLGVASDLVRILFTGFVAMMALAGGLAFGLGGQDTARDVLKSLKSKLEK